MKAAYLDTSAAVKLVVNEPQSPALQSWLRGRMLTSSALLRVELARAVRRHGPIALRRAESLIRDLDLIRLGKLVLDRAAALEPAHLRALDAIHIASAELLSTAVLVSYDRRLVDAASGIGLAVASPA